MTDVTETRATVTVTSTAGTSAPVVGAFNEPPVLVLPGEDLTFSLKSGLVRHGKGSATWTSCPRKG